LPLYIFLEEGAKALVGRFNHDGGPTVSRPHQLDFVMLLLEGLRLFLLSFIILQLYLNLFAIDNSVVRIIIHFAVSYFLWSLGFFSFLDSVFKRLIIWVDLYLTAYPVVPDDCSLLLSKVKVLEEFICNSFFAETSLRASRHL